MDTNGIFGDYQLIHEVTPANWLLRNFPPIVSHCLGRDVSGLSVICQWQTTIYQPLTNCHQLYLVLD